ncbi:MAG: hypothetical protein CUN55_06535 [Phototrophicales bacterium]|nr:MAG: hypothetical protein CUN55_06535 [Phototrophicales bacterium]
MTLQHELTTLPKDAITILRYISQHRGKPLSIEQIQNGTNLSDRALSKGIKRLVTRYFMSMDEARFYHIMPKGEQAIELLMNDASLLGSDDEQVNTIPFALAAVLPRQVSPNKPVRWLLGVNPASAEQLTYPAELFFRMSAENGNIHPTQVTLHVSPQKSEDFTELTLVAGNAPVRVQIEAYQMLDMDEPNMAGGMYFDVEVGTGNSEMRAVYTTIRLL